MNLAIKVEAELIALSTDTAAIVCKTDLVPAAV